MNEVCIWWRGGRGSHHQVRGLGEKKGRLTKKDKGGGKKEVIESYGYVPHLTGKIQ